MRKTPESLDAKRSRSVLENNQPYSAKNAKSHEASVFVNQIETENTLNNFRYSPLQATRQYLHPNGQISAHGQTDEHHCYTLRSSFYLNKQGKYDDADVYQCESQAKPLKPNPKYLAGSVKVFPSLTKADIRYKSAQVLPTEPKINARLPQGDLGEDDEVIDLTTTRRSRQYESSGQRRHTPNTFNNNALGDYIYEYKKSMHDQKASSTQPTPIQRTTYTHYINSKNDHFVGY